MRRRGFPHLRGNHLPAHAFRVRTSKRRSDWSTRTPPAGKARPARRRQPHHPAQEEEDRSQGLCTRCPLSDACTDYAIANDYRDGIWGGLTVDERDQLTRERATVIADEN
ncbi:WhiB family transcriptional regulator [Streptomyces sp. FB2]|uniref:WhiB family transcriptional regulator n=1 Tax=Streptomyces sp. FB2 TaxID=2902454 RepID=UPI0035ABD5DE